MLVIGIKLSFRELNRELLTPLSATDILISSRLSCCMPGDLCEMFTEYLMSCNVSCQMMKIIFISNVIWSFHLGSNNKPFDMNRR